MTSIPQDSKLRLGVTFHRTFALNSSAISKLLAISAELGADTDARALSERTNLGSIYIEAMPRYARGCGLLTPGGYTLTSLGKAVLERDPNLDRAESLWCMHYHMSAPQGPGPAFWNHLVLNHFQIGTLIRSGGLIDIIGYFVESAGGGRLAARSLKGTAAAFLGTYAKSDGLGKLRLLRAVDDKNGVYAVQEPEPPSASVLAYALADYWSAAYPGRSEVLISELSDPQGFAALFFLGSAALMSRLTELQTKKLLMVKSDMPPFVVTRLWSDPHHLAEQIYD